MTGEIGTAAWMAPELWRADGYGASADVYSLGIVLWELLAQAHPYDGVPLAHLPLLVVAQRRRPAIPPGAHPGYTRLVTACWADDPLARPSAASVHAELCRLRSRELDAWEAAAGGAAVGGAAADPR